MSRTVTFRHVFRGGRKINGRFTFVIRSVLSVTSGHVWSRFVTFPFKVGSPFQSLCGMVPHIGPKMLRLTFLACMSVLEKLGLKCTRQDMQCGQENMSGEVFRKLAFTTLRFWGSNSHREDWEEFELEILRAKTFEYNIYIYNFHSGAPSCNSSQNHLLCAAKRKRFFSPQK